MADGTWDGVEEEKALAKLDGGGREALIAALRAMPTQRWESAADCAAALRAASNGALAKPSAAIIKALASRCIVRDQSLPEQHDSKGRIEWDPELRDTENVPLLEDVSDYLSREVLPHVPDARVENADGRIGYEIPFTRLFYKYTPPRPSEEIKAELREREARIRQLLERGALVTRLRYVAKLNPAVSGLAKGDAGTEVSYLPLERIWSDERFDASHAVEFTGDVQSYNPVAEGDVLLPKVSPTFTHGRVAIATGLVNGRGLASSEVFVIRPFNPEDARFLKYRLLARDFITEGEASWTGVAGLKRVSSEFVLNTRIANAAWAARRAISDFLDRECTRLDELRARAEELADGVVAEALERLRAVVLDAGWPLAPVKYYARTGTGHTPSRTHPEYWFPEECVVPWFTLADVNQIRDGRAWVVENTTERISEVGLANSSAEKHPVGTVLLSRTASVGFSAVMGTDMAVSQDFMTWTCGPGLDPYYLLVALRVMQPELRRLMYGSTHKTIYMPDLHALRIPLPPLDRQLSIVREARERLAVAWALRDDLVALDAGLAEYRAAVVTQAVTGILNVGRRSDQEMDESAGVTIAAGSGRS